jgi:hypothetical protein
MLILAGMIVLLSLSERIEAKTFKVNSTDDVVDVVPGDGICATETGACTLRASIQESNALAGADKVVLKAKKYALTLSGAAEDAAATGDLDITDSLSIVGKGAAYTIIDGNHSDRVFHIIGTPSTSVRLVGLTVQNGVVGADYGGGILIDSAMGTIHLCTIKNNVTFSSEGGSLGGGIANIDGVLNVSSSFITLNSASGIGDFAMGGGIFNSGDHAVLTVKDSRVSGNKVSAAYSPGGAYDPIAMGGGIASHDANSVTITGSKIMNNSTEAYGASYLHSCGAGLLINNNADHATITDTKILGNVAAGRRAHGGGVAVLDSNAIFSRCKVAGNDASTFFSFGGGFYLYGASTMSVTIDNMSKIINNYASLHGGGILIEGDLLLSLSEDAVVEQNSVEDIYTFLSM